MPKRSRKSQSKDARQQELKLTDSHPASPQSPASDPAPKKTAAGKTRQSKTIQSASAAAATTQPSGDSSPSQPKIQLACLGRPKPQIKKTAYRTVWDPQIRERRATKREAIRNLGLKSETAYLWDEQHFEDNVKKIVREKVNGENGLNGDWSGFVFDAELQKKLADESTKNALSTQASSKKADINAILEDLEIGKKIDSKVYLYEPDSKPPKKADTPLKSVIFRKLDQVFSDANLKKKLKRVVDRKLAQRIENEWEKTINAQATNSKFLTDLWYEFADQFRQNPQNPHSPPVRKIRLFESDTTLNDFSDLSKDGRGAYYRLTNAKGYFFYREKNKKKWKLRSIKATESESAVRKELENHVLYDKTPWRWGDLLEVKPSEEKDGTKKFYTFRNAYLDEENVRIDAEPLTPDAKRITSITTLLKEKRILCVSNDPNANFDPGSAEG